MQFRLCCEGHHARKGVVQPLYAVWTAGALDVCLGRVQHFSLFSCEDEVKKLASLLKQVASGDGSSGESIPMVLRFPRLFDPWGGYGVLGFTLSSRYDKAKKKTWKDRYFLWLAIGYACGLLLTHLGLYLMNGHGQPGLLALSCSLYIVGELGAKNVKS